MEQFPHLLDCAQLFFLRTSKDPSKVQLWEMLLTVFGEILGFKLVHKSIRHDWIFFWWDWALNSGLHTCKAGGLLLEPYFSPFYFLIWLFWRQGTCDLFCPHCPWTTILLISVSQVARIIGMSHHDWIKKKFIIILLYCDIYKSAYNTYFS
jgi:hypothetical protein